MYRALVDGVHGVYGVHGGQCDVDLLTSPVTFIGAFDWSDRTINTKKCGMKKKEEKSDRNAVVLFPCSSHNKYYKLVNILLLY